MGERQQHRLRTFLSPVYFRWPANPPEKSAGEILEFPTRSYQKFLFDDLLGGGIVIPGPLLAAHANRESDDKAQGLFVLLVGPPGSGKSTFALELCYRLACNKNLGLGKLGELGLSSVYFSCEAPTENICDQANEFGWKEGPNDLANPTPLIPLSRSTEVSPEFAHVYVQGNRELFNDESFHFDAKQWFEGVSDRWDGIVNIPPYRHSIVVLDSLNVLQRRSDTDVVLEEIIARHGRRVLMTVAMLDCHLDSTTYDRWEHFADLVIYLGYDLVEDYMLRKVRVVKARYQDHADGEHRLKINPRPSKKVELHPMSPFIKAGGIFVFPSVHRYLSVSRREATEDTTRFDGPIQTPFSALNEIIQGKGFPEGACTAIVGSRGGMKSHLAYYTLLKFLSENPEERALIISMRDPVGSAKDTLAEIMANQRDEHGQRLNRTRVKSIADAKKAVTQYLSKDRLDILFFWPGYISPEEFFHLVAVAVDRKHKNKPVSLVIVNGLEQLSARFPLCAKEKMFVSGLVTLLCVKGTTNVIVSGGDVNLPSDRGGVPAGLLQMADLIIESTFRLIPKNRVWSDSVWPADNTWRRVLREKQFQAIGGLPDSEPHVVYQIIREPGARECRRRVLFYMGRADDEEPFYPGSVHARLLTDDFPYGDKL